MREWEIVFAYAKRYVNPTPMAKGDASRIECAGIGESRNGFTYHRALSIASNHDEPVQHALPQETSG
ncbi:hypothetical protein PT2222_60068 [Paraburkholderia tropica]